TSRVGEAIGASRLIDISSAHITSCYYNGRPSLDFAERLAALGAHVAVPTTLNAVAPPACLARRGSDALLHPQYRGGTPDTEEGGRLMDLYASLGARPTFTCAPYQLPGRPGLGENIAWAESNAVVFANSVLGARTNKYGEFIDICAAVTGRVPDVGL